MTTDLNEVGTEQRRDFMKMIVNFGGYTKCEEFCLADQTFSRRNVSRGG